MGNVKVSVDFSGTRGNYVIREISKPVSFPEKETFTTKMEASG